jgi:predicted RNase H-like nuclease (RuvC/YqgF family)
MANESRNQEADVRNELSKQIEDYAWRNGITDSVKRHEKEIVELGSKVEKLDSKIEKLGDKVSQYKDKLDDHRSEFNSKLMIVPFMGLFIMVIGFVVKSLFF